MPDTTHMLAGELMFAFGAPLAHVVAYETRLREQQLDRVRRQFARERRTGSRRFA